MGRLEEYAAKRDQNNDPGGYKTMPYGSFQQDYVMDGWGFTNTTSQKAREEAVKAAQQKPVGSIVLPTLDTTNPLGSLVELLGPTPAEREAQERRMLQNRAKMQAWTGLFDGLRQLGNLYYATKGATPQTYANPYNQVDQEMQQQRQLRDSMVNYKRQYATSLYNLQRQMEADKRAKEQHDANISMTKAREEALREDSRRKDEYNLARTKYYEAVANKNDEQAKYWELRAEGVPKESAAKIAKDYAMAAKANRTGGGSGKSGTGNSETEVVEWLGADGKKHKKTVKTTGGKRNGSLLPGNQGRGSLLPR